MPNPASPECKHADRRVAGAIVLMHDGGNHPQTARALPAVIRGLRARGLRMVTVTALLGQRFIFTHPG